ncbi:MAG: UDP-glucose/GDP-mannose dehydrogenase family protein [Spirochaetales bacterium]|nr:UDP-glucose/GDP-mannose dehydrogenase family protein [Spirochaetales bacterium]
MAKKITVMGTGYVGLISAVGLADFGHTVTGVDISQPVVDKLNAGEPHIFETGLRDYLQKNLNSGRLRFSTDIKDAIKLSEVVLISVGTPPKEDGSADLTQLLRAAKEIKRNAAGHKVVVIKSTVPVGTNRTVLDMFNTNGCDIDVVSNPEFLREGKAIQDFFHPDRIILGVESERAKAVMEDIYRSLYLIQTPFVWCNLETAELIKYSSNAFLANKVTFINQMANLAEVVGADIHDIAKAMGMDGRISSKFLHPGPGFGGSCFPKDIKALVSMGEKFGVDMSLVREVIRANEAQKQLMISKLKGMLGDLKHKTVAVLGLAFKAETDDVRESPAISIVAGLLHEDCRINAHDPIATRNFSGLFPDINYCEDEYEALQKADALIICTEWNEYRNLDLHKVKQNMKGNVILDTRNLLNREQVRQRGFIYQGVGR